jgi:4-alpha-glucanotransferase
MSTHPLSRRSAGVLCHVTSIPDGDVVRFLDFLAAAEIRIWQILPLNPPDSHRSPYQSHSLAALSPALSALRTGSEPLLDDEALDAYRCLASSTGEDAWLDDFAVFEAAVERHGPSWSEWPQPLRDRDRAALDAFAAREQALIEACVRAQFAAAAAWERVRQAARARDILILGDMPLYPAHGSVDVWANPGFFQLDASGRPNRVAGVPPDYFSATGQRWGNPLYDWSALQAQDFRWWHARVRRLLSFYDVLRIDHFRGLSAYWAIPADADSARDGVWEPAPGAALLRSLADRLGGLPLVAEDLGIIDEPVVELRDAFGLPGMRVLQFGFSGDPNNPHLPQQYPTNCVAYTATHDNDTCAGWYAGLSPEERRAVDALLAPVGDPGWRMASTVFHSPAATAVAPLQDLLPPAAGQRMNTPGTESGNWGWRFDWDALTPALAARVAGLVRESGRA